MLPFSEILSTGDAFKPLAIAATCVSVGWLVASVVRIALAPRHDADRDLFEQGRRSALRSASVIYRWFEPLVDELAVINSSAQAATVVSLQTNFRTLRDAPPWLPAEYLAVSQLVGVGLALCCMAIITPIQPIAGIVGGLLLVPLWQYLSVGQIREAATKRAREVKLRFPFALDLLAMMMAAGLVFERSLKNVVNCSANHPLGIELGELLRQIDLGTTPREAFHNFSLLFEDDDLREFVSSVIQGLDLGTPLATIFRIQADQMRMKRSQWIEKAAAQAEVQITAPGLVVGLGCMLILLAPFLLAAMANF